MSYLKQQIRIHSFKKLILWLLVIPPICVFVFLEYSKTEQTQGFTIFLLVIAGLMSLLIIHALWLTLFPYTLTEFKLLKNAYGLTPEMIEQSIVEDVQNGHLIKKKGVLITQHYCIVQTIRYTRIIALDELLELRMKNSLDILAYLWWLPRMFLYVQEERRSYRVHMSKKMIFILFQRISQGLNTVKLPQEFKWNIKTICDEAMLSPMEKTLENMNQQIFMNTVATHLVENNDQVSSHWRKLGHFMVINFLLLFAIFLVSIGAASIAPLMFFFVYMIVAVILTILRIIRLFKVTREFGGTLSYMLFIASTLVLLIMPKYVFNLGNWLIELFVGNY